MPKTNSVSPDHDESSFGDPAEDNAAPDISDATSLSDLTRSAVVEIKGKPVKVEYDLSEMTPRLRKRLSNLEDSENSEDVIIEYLGAIVIAWDLNDRRGNPVALEDMDAVSYKDLGKIAEAINKDLSPNA